MRQKADEAAAIAAVDGVKENGKVVVFSFFGKAHDDHERIYNVVTEFIAADGDKPEKLHLVPYLQLLPLPQQTPLPQNEHDSSWAY